MSKSEPRRGGTRKRASCPDYFADTGDCCPPQSTSNPSKPNVPHPVSDPTGYEYKGKFESVGDYEKVYVTGPNDAKHALVVIYDIFGFWDTTIRADRGRAKLDDRLPEVLNFAKALKKDHGINRVSILGYCWGGKLALLSLTSGTPFCCGAVIHPAMIAPEDGENLTVPFGFYPSMVSRIEKIEEAIKSKPFASKSDYHLYDTVHHGWAAARADLKNPENLKQYEDVYQRTADYFAKVKC
ncbi:hypothetical protein I203_103292 [Kwoniella mangroviensis CBS 8507]|uniref:uncharacterized protein n=1 Tax=Kwoniella mangroviensis CBS 8507 TaxID=1296122 RepID=UPI003034235D